MAKIHNTPKTILHCTILHTYETDFCEICKDCLCPLVRHRHLHLLVLRLSTGIMLSGAKPALLVDCRLLLSRHARGRRPCQLYQRVSGTVLLCAMDRGYHLGVSLHGVPVAYQAGGSQLRGQDFPQVVLGFRRSLGESLALGCDGRHRGTALFPRSIDPVPIGSIDHECSHKEMGSKDSLGGHPVHSRSVLADGWRCCMALRHSTSY